MGTVNIKRKLSTMGPNSAGYHMMKLSIEFCLFSQISWFYLNFILKCQFQWKYITFYHENGILEKAASDKNRKFSKYDNFYSWNESEYVISLHNAWHFASMR